MRAVTIVLGVWMALSGCANTCEFGQSGNNTVGGMKCYGLLDEAEIGMTMAQVQKEIGNPDTRRFDMSYMGKSYDEAWIYALSSPPTVLYFKNGVLQKKDYDYSNK
jgi:hypothetical protein